MKIPLAYGPKDKFIARVEMNSELDKEFSIILPRMGFELLNYEYDADRKLPTINRFVQADRNGTPDKRQYQYNPVPYNLNFVLSIFVKNTEDGLRILEQILPYFTPEWTSTVELISNPQVTLDIPIYLNDVSVEDIYQGNFEERRTLVYNLNFTLKGYIFGPVKRTGIIKLANTNFFIEDTYNTTIDQLIANVSSNDTISGARVTVYPGLTANGEPTTDSAQTIPYANINSTDDYGYVTIIEDPEITE